MIKYKQFHIDKYKNITNTKPLYVVYDCDGTIFYNSFQLRTTEFNDEFCVYGTDLDYEDDLFFDIRGNCKNKPHAKLMIGSHFIINGWINMYSNFHSTRIFKTKEAALENIEPLKYSSRQIGTTYDERYDEYVSFDPQYDDTISISYYKKDRAF